jgi:hypothetical protein
MQKEYFNTNIKHRTSFFKGKKVSLLYSDLPGDECFEKFAIGKEDFHKSKSGEKCIDRLRLERFNWIFEILDKYEKCELCANLLEYPDKKNDKRINISCFFNKYKIVISLAYKNSKKDEYVVLTAFYMEQR